MGTSDALSIVVRGGGHGGSSRGVIRPVLYCEGSASGFIQDILFSVAVVVTEYHASGAGGVAICRGRRSICSEV